MRAILLISIFLFAFTPGHSQLVIDDGASVNVSNGSKIYAAGNVTGNASIKGAGTLVMNGSSLQTLNMNSDTISHLEINNGSNVVLGTGNLIIDSSLTFINGKLKIGLNDLLFSPQAVTSGANSSAFIWTDGSGYVKKGLTADVIDFLFPLGENNNYRPAYITTSGCTYSSGMVGLQLKNVASPNMPPMIGNYIAAYWPVSKFGISGGSVTLKGTYKTTDISGAENKLSGYYNNGTDWSSQNETHDYAQHQVSAPVSGNNGSLFAMNKFVVVGARALLQGAYNASNGLMSDALRSGTNLIPISDPYRTAPYSTYFTHVNNPIAENAVPSIFGSASSVNDNIVDWVFLELRNTTVTPGNSILATRSALIQRDGDIVDIDGSSPVTFNNIPEGNYVLAVRHRNHLGISLNPANGYKIFNEATSTAYSTNVADFRLSNTTLYGTTAAYNTASHPLLGNVKLLWAGNASLNGNTKYTGLQNDKDAILITALGNNAATVLSNVYSPADINMNRVIRFNGLANDKDYLYINILNSSTTTQRIQALP